MPGTTVPRGNILYSFLAVPVLTPVAVAQNISAEQSFTIPGLKVGDFVTVNVNVAQTAGISIGNSRVSAADTLQISFCNDTGGSLTPASGVYYLDIKRPESFSNLPTVA